MNVIMLLFLLPAFVYLSDVIGRRNLMRYSGFATAIIAIPIFWLLVNPMQLVGIIIAQIILCIFHAAFVAPHAAFVVELFNTKARYSGAAVNVGIGEILGGFTPFIALILVYKTGDFRLPALCLVVSGLLGGIAATFAKLTTDKVSVDDTGLKDVVASGNTRPVAQQHAT